MYPACVIHAINFKYLSCIIIITFIFRYDPFIRANDSTSYAHERLTHKSYDFQIYCVYMLMDSCIVYRAIL